MDQNKLLAQAVSFPIEGPGINPGTTSDQSIVTLDKIVSNLIGFMSIIAIIWFAIQVILAGYKYISSKGDKNKIEEAGKSLTNGILGLLIVIIAVFLTSFLTKLMGLGDVLDLPAQIQKLII